MSELALRVDALLAAIGSRAVTRPELGDTVSDADAQSVATTQIDELLRRVAALTGVVSDEGRDWDDVDRIAARLLIADLAAIASTTRALNHFASVRLAQAITHLRAAGVDVERAVKEASTGPVVQQEGHTTSS